MYWVIAILLALILVALMASDKAASVAVKKVIRIALVGVALLACALLLLALLTWFHVSWAGEDWWQTAPVVVLVLLFLVSAWTQRKSLAAKFAADKWGSLAIVGKVLGACALTLLIGYALKATLEAYELSGWWLIACGLAVSGVGLLTLTARNPEKWRDVWFGPAPLPSPWSVALNARMQAEVEEQAIIDREYESWHDLTPAEQGAIEDRRTARFDAVQARLAAIEEQAEAAVAQQLTQAKSWTFREFFWFFVVLGALGLIRLYWQYGFDWAMTWKVVNGREWVAGAFLIVGGVAILGVIASIFEEVEKFLQSRRYEKDNKANAS